MKGRQRGRNGGGGGGGGGGKPRPPGRNPNFDGNNRPRGNAQQLMEKYLALARDASSAGDRVLAENYFQHADHYYRVLNARFEQQNGQPRRFDGQGQGPGQHHPYDRQGNYGHDQGEGQPHSYQGGYQNPQPQHQQPHQPAHQQHHHAPAETGPQPGNEAEIALPPGILGEPAASEGAGEANEPEETQDGGSEQQQRHRHGGRRRRGRGDRPFANANE